MSCHFRYDCQAIELEVKRSQAQAKSIKVSSLPNVNLSVSETRSSGQLFTPDSDRQLMLEFSWAIFSGGQRNSKRKSIDAQSDAIQSQLFAFQQNIQLQITQARSSLRNARSQISLAQKSLELDQERLRLSRKRYEGGLLNIDELLDSEASLARSETDLERAKLQNLIAITEMHLSTGKPFEK